jgi:tRNA (cytidine/uridine-2'-O-)-methyltransferase
MDYADKADLIRHDSWARFLCDRPVGRLILLSTKANVSLWDFQFQTTDVLILGRETAGVPPAVADACDERINLPMCGNARSLNVAMCAGIALAEALRQTRQTN